MSEKLPGVDLLGEGYDLRGRYADPEDVILPLFDFGNATKDIEIGGKKYVMPADVEIDVHPIRHCYYEYTSGKTVEDYRVNLNRYSKVNVGYKLFTGALNESFGIEHLENCLNEFVTVRSVIELWKVNLPDVDIMRKKLRPEVKSALNGAMLPLEVIKKYGAYYLAELTVGGRVDYTSSINKANFETSYDIEFAATLGFKEQIFELSAEEAAKYSKVIKSLKENSHVALKTIGGNPALGAKIGYGDKEAFTDWSNSVMEAPTLIAFTDRSLRPIWEFCDSSDRANALKMAFDQYMKDSQQDISQGIPIAEIFITGNMQLAGTDQGGGAHRHLSVYRPYNQEGCYWIGHYGQGDYNSPSEKTVYIRPLFPGVVRSPIAYEKVWDDAGSGKIKDYSCWKPIPPAGYKVLGCIMRLRASNQNPPSGQEIENFVCVREELLEQAKLSDDDLWNDNGSKARNHCSLWRVLPNRDNGIAAGTFWGNNNYTKPTNVTVWCLRKDKAVVKLEAR